MHALDISHTNQTVSAMGDSVSPSVRDFQTFYRDWIARLELYLDQLLSVLQFQDHENESKLHVQQLVHNVMTHYHDYFLAKAKLSSQHVFLVLSPPWLSSYERTFLWLAGFKPGLAFNVVNSCGIQLSTGQSDMMDRLRAEIENEENAIAKRLATFEQQVVAPPMLAFAKIMGKNVDGMVRDIDTTVELLADDMECLVSCADHLRGKTVAKVVGILTTAQSVRFFAGLAQLQLGIRKLGQLRDNAGRGQW